jgi:hypothetical protein
VSSDKLCEVTREIVKVLEAKAAEDMSLVESMLEMVPLGKDDFRPEWRSSRGDAAFTILELAQHLVDASSGLCACFSRLHPLQLEHFTTLQDQIHNSEKLRIVTCRDWIAQCRSHIAEGFALCSDADLTRKIETYFSPQGEPLLETLLANWKHWNHHAYQLFLYLKLMGVPVGTEHLYRFRNEHG